jgi:hypothetical protein
MTPTEKIEVLCDAFKQENSSELRLLLHSIVKSNTYLIEHAYPILKKLPGIDPTSISSIEIHSKVVNFELNNLRIYIKALENIRNTPKAIILIDDDATQKPYYEERCSRKGIKFHFYSSVAELLEKKFMHTNDEMVVIDWYLGGKTTGDQAARELKKDEHGFKTIYITSSVEIDITPFKDLILGYLPKNPSWI